MARAPWIEPDEVWDGGPGAHAENSRYDHVDDPDGKYDTVQPAVTLPPRMRLALALAIPDTSPGRLDMADSSHYQVEQATMDLVRAKASGIRGWAHKVSQSTGYIDPTWARVCAQMLTSDFDWMAGYHWVSSTTDPQKQAAWFIQCLGEAAGSMALMGDSEETPLSVANDLGFYEEVERLRAKLFGIQAPCTHYTGAFVTSGTLFSDPRLRESKYGMRPTIIAAYTTRQKMLALPNVQRMGFQAWQYQSSGPVTGVKGRCDMDEIQDMGAFRVSMHGAYTPPTPPPIKEVDMPYIITAAGRNPAIVDAQYATGISGPTLLGATVPVMNLADPAEWDAIVAISDGKKAADAAVANLTAPQTAGAPTSFTGTVELHAG